MRKFKAPDTTLIAISTMAAIAVAVAAFSSLTVLSTPTQLRSRRNAIEAGIERTRVTFRQPRAPSHYLADPLCHVPAAVAGDQVRAELIKAAHESGVATPTITLASTKEDLTSDTIPVMFTLDVTDRYDLVLGFLNHLAQAEPEVFADTLDLTSKTSAVSLKLAGRVECQSSS